MNNYKSNYNVSHHTNYYNCLSVHDPNNDIDTEQQGVLGTGCSNHALRSNAPTDEKSPVQVPHICGTPTGTPMPASHCCLLKYIFYPTKPA